MQSTFDERNWLAWLVKVRILILTVLLGIELAVAQFTPTPLPLRLFISTILLWYSISLFYVLLLSFWQEHRVQAGHDRHPRDPCVAQDLRDAKGGQRESRQDIRRDGPGEWAGPIVAAVGRQRGGVGNLIDILERYHLNLVCGAPPVDEQV